MKEQAVSKKKVKSAAKKTDWSKGIPVKVEEIDEETAMRDTLKDAGFNVEGLEFIRRPVPANIPDSFTTVEASSGPVFEIPRKYLRQWEAYKQRHKLTDQKVFEDLLGGVEERSEKCSNCGTEYFARYNEVFEELKCPKCKLTWAQAEKKAHPEVFKNNWGANRKRQK